MKATVDTDLCIGCGACTGVCPISIITIEDNKAVVGEECLGCGLCVEACPVNAIRLQ